MLTGNEFAKLFSENEELNEKMFSTGNEELDTLLERVYSEGVEDGYDYAQGELRQVNFSKINYGKLYKLEGAGKISPKRTREIIQQDLDGISKGLERRSSRIIKSQNNVHDVINMGAGAEALGVTKRLNEIFAKDYKNDKNAQPVLKKLLSPKKAKQDAYKSLKEKISRTIEANPTEFNYRAKH